MDDWVKNAQEFDPGDSCWYDTKTQQLMTWLLSFEPKPWCLPKADHTASVWRSSSTPVAGMLHQSCCFWSSDVCRLPVSLFECRIKTPALWWYGALLPLMKARNVQARWLLAIGCSLLVVFKHDTSLMPWPSAFVTVGSLLSFWCIWGLETHLEKV